MPKPSTCAVLSVLVARLGEGELKGLKASGLISLAVHSIRLCLKESSQVELSEEAVAALWKNIGSPIHTHDSTIGVDSS